MHLKSRNFSYKFTRGKDLTLATQQQKAAIFGGVKEVVQEKEEVKEEVLEREESAESESQQLSVSTISATDYYKERMAKWLNKKNTPVEQTDEMEETKKSKKSRKRKFVNNSC